MLLDGRVEAVISGDWKGSSKVLQRESDSWVRGGGGLKEGGGEKQGCYTAQRAPTPCCCDEPRVLPQRLLHCFLVFTDQISSFICNSHLNNKNSQTAWWWSDWLTVFCWCPVVLWWIWLFYLCYLVSVKCLECCCLSNQFPSQGSKSWDTKYLCSWGIARNQ